MLARFFSYRGRTRRRGGCVLRRSAREAALQSLFQMDIGKVDMETALETALSFHELSLAAEEFSKKLIEVTWTNLAQIDKLLQSYSIGWSLERMGNVDRNILRIAICELLFFEIPPSVSINEAVELSKEYGDVNSSRFVNGILGNIARETKPLK